MNPDSFPLASGGKVTSDRGIFIFNYPLFMRNVSRQFLDVIRGNLEIVLMARPKEDNMPLEWSSDVINVQALEETYIAHMISNETMFGYGEADGYAKKREEVLKKRFRLFLERVSFWINPKEKLSIEAVFDNKKIIVK